MEITQITDQMNVTHGSDGRISAEAVTWAFRLFVGREPESADEIEFHRRNPTIDVLRRAFAGTLAFKAFMQKEFPKPYTAPLWLLHAPDNAAIPWNWGPPTLANPVSQLCTHEQMTGPLYESISATLGLPLVQSRKYWEFVYIYAALRDYGALREGAKLLAFGAGQEPLPSAVARLGAKILATDAPPEVIAGDGWQSKNQHSKAMEDLYKPNLIDFESFKQNVQFRPVDMNNIPDDLHGFDACWSACAFEHIGGIEAGLKFVENSLKTLRPGGLAIHTTEFNMSSNDETFESRNLCLFRRRDIENLLGRLIDQGHKVMPLNLFPGRSEVDAHIDLPPYSWPHLKLRVASFVSTSIGLIVRAKS